MTKKLQQAFTVPITATLKLNVNAMNVHFCVRQGSVCVLEMLVRPCRQGLPKLLPVQQPPLGIDNLSRRQDTIDQAGSPAQDRDAYPPMINTLFVVVCVFVYVHTHAL